MSQSNHVADESAGKTFRDRLGELLRTNKVSIFLAILFVFFVNRVDIFAPNLRELGIHIALALLAIWLISWLKGVGWSDLGFYKPNNWLHVILLGIGVAVILQSSALLQIRLGGPMPDLSSFEYIKNNPIALLGGLVIAWTTAGFGEEIIWRGFFMKQIARLFDESRTGWVVSLFVSAAVFGLIHAYQGVTGILMTGFAGLVYGFIFLRSKRNLWTTILAHALTDTLGFILLFYWDKISFLVEV